MGTLSPTLNILIGVAGSGKSTVTKQIISAWVHKKFRIICPDDIREEFCNGDRSDQSKNNLVWAAAYERLEEELSDRKDVIFDSTMLTPKSRKRLIEIGKDHGCYIIAHVVDCDLERILKQNAERKWKVPEHIVKSMFERFTVPTKDEGFDSILTYGKDGLI